ncbi:aminotransferase class I/II-fold pyridoxal phosphate-dependent enzyme [Novosphingobium flavum]|uniref:aspartate transaminase n=1 Tax=Novosphingobium flavum TaxID=1778672 RepID=A0A7X1FNK0_9SPHN|nr:aminotransferase class I/II-fold pyridoxal phosphate-dependent enzyme [Novosphingobium flavum]MBC2664071.1 aminotransferase class I/II-fold pyridoxal phosphate-dependent enzyme [Novosphingobium flavum]
MRAHPVYAGMGLTIFEYMSGLCRDGSRVNLGQGFPDDFGPAELRDAAARALSERSSQYPPMAGVPELREGVAAFYGRTQGLPLAAENVIVTSGATEALTAAILALVSAGDEVLLFAPSYDLYAPMVRRAGGVPVFVPLRPPHWRYLREEIEARITPRTRALILNDPLNPTGSVASEAELAMLAEICLSRDLVAICDEVWEAVRFDGKVHRSLLAFPGMESRTVKIGSAGKLFGLTGWKIGWMVAAPALAAVLGRAHQFLTFTTMPATQYAVAEGLAVADLMAARLAGWAATRDHLNGLLAEAGFAALPGPATWFTCIDLAASGIALDDATFSERAVREALVATIPISAFLEQGERTAIVRLCHCKDMVTLSEGVSRLEEFRRKLA